MRRLLKLVVALPLIYFAGIILFGICLYTLVFASFPLFNEKHTYTLDEIGQIIHSPIPKDATDIQYSSEMHRGYFIKLSFNAPPTSADQFAANLCQGIFFKGYDPFNASNSYSAHPSDVVLKAIGYAYFSFSSSTVKSIYGNRCSIEGRWVQIKIDRADPHYYSIRLETLSYTCDIDVMCSAPYGFDNTAYRPLPKDSLLPLTIYGLENSKVSHVLHGQIICVETVPDSFSSWTVPPFNLNDFKGASFELFVDDVSKGQAVISNQGRLSVDYSTRQFIGIRESPEYCFQVDAKDGVYQMSVNVKTRAGQSYHYAWPFTVQTSTSSLTE